MAPWCVTVLGTLEDLDLPDGFRGQISDRGTRMVQQGLRPGREHLVVAVHPGPARGRGGGEQQHGRSRGPTPRRATHSTSGRARMRRRPRAIRGPLRRLLRAGSEPREAGDPPMRHQWAAAVLVVLVGPALGQAAAAPIVCRSPDGTLTIELALRKDGTVDGVPHYRVRAGATAVIGWSRLGVDLAGGESLGGPCEVTGVETRSVRDEYTQFPGKRRAVVGHASEALVRLRETTKPNRRWELVLRAYDDGVAFRYRFPAQDGWDQLVIAGERTEFRVPADARGFALPLNGFTTSYESRYQVKPAGELPKDGLIGLPLLFERPGGAWAAITEADVDEYAGLYLAPAGGGTLAARLSPLPKEPKLAVRAALPHASPWRVVMAADRAGRLIESDIVLNLSKPRAIKDVSWIKPGKTTFPWWNGYVLDGADFKPGQNTATHKHYIDFCAGSGIEYHSLDGLDNIAWYGGTIVPYEGADPTKALPDIDLPEVLKYARAKEVRLRLWMHWGAAEKHMARAFPLYKEWGVEGVMLDFMDRDDQEMNRFLRKAVKLAAENQL